MSVRYHRGGTYQTRNPLAACNPLRSIPLLRPAAAVFGTSWHDGTWNQSKVASVGEPLSAPALPPIDPIRELANAEANLRAAIRVYDYARKEIGDANRTKIPEVICNGCVVTPARPFTPERIRERKSYAFKLFNKRRGELTHARRRVDAARAALGQPNLATVEERAAVATVVRASKQRPVVSSPYCVCRGSRWLTPSGRAAPGEPHQQDAARSD